MSGEKFWHETDMCDEKGTVMHLETSEARNCRIIPDKLGQLGWGGSVGADGCGRIVLGG